LNVEFLNIVLCATNQGEELGVGVGHGGYCVLVLSVGQKPSLG
jgi:hypothetical protein